MASSNHPPHQPIDLKVLCMAFSPRRRPPHPADQPPVTPPSPERLRSLAFALLAQREWSKAGLQARLLETGAALEDVQALTDELHQSGYQDDQRMAAMLVRANVRRGRGPARIRQEFQKRQLDGALAAPELAETDWLAQARALRLRKFGDKLPAEAKEKARQVRFLQYRGFDLTVCLQAVNQNPDAD